MESGTIQSITSGLYSWMSGDNQNVQIKDLANHQILRIANEINGVFASENISSSVSEKITMPRLVVIGTQSSGKSTVLNTIMSLDILPTGKNMVTRTPLDIRLHNTKGTEQWVEIGDYYDSGWQIEKKIIINTIGNVPNSADIETVTKYIQYKTNQIAGFDNNISAKPVIIQIYSPNVPDLSLIDLPGLIMVACTDKGQPEDIKEQIEKLIESYIKHPKTIILAVMQSRTDLETDLGLALIKKYSKANTRAIGILTKPDLLNENSNVGDYLVGKISKNLMLQYGYHVIKNNVKLDQNESFDIIKNLEAERKFFQNHTEYKKSIYKSKTGYDALIKNLINILIESIKLEIPNTLNILSEIEFDNRKKLDGLGTKPPTTKDGQLAEINMYVNAVCNRLTECIESKGTIPNIGKIIKQIFESFRSDIINMDIISHNDNDFKEIISSYEGYHMSSVAPPIDILEKCITDNKHLPIMKMKSRCSECIQQVHNAIIEAVNQIMIEDQFIRFPQLSVTIVRRIVDDIIIPIKNNTEEHVNELFKIEQSYIWTDDHNFENILKKGLTSSGVGYLKEMLIGYLFTVKNTFRNMVPKYIMTFFIRELQIKLMTYLVHEFVKEDKLELLKEDPEIEIQRKHYESLNIRITTIRGKLN